MFTEAIGNDADARTATFRTHLSRHVEVDRGGAHLDGVQMLVDLCADGDKRWRQCAEAALYA